MLHQEIEPLRQFQKDLGEPVFQLLKCQQFLEILHLHGFNVAIGHAYAHLLLIVLKGKNISITQSLRAVYRNRLREMLHICIHTLYFIDGGHAVLPSKYPVGAPFQ